MSRDMNVLPHDEMWKGNESDRVAGLDALTGGSWLRDPLNGRLSSVLRSVALNEPSTDVRSDGFHDLLFGSDWCRPLARSWSSTLMA